MTRKLAKFASIAFLLRIASAAVTYCFVIILARILETDDFGIVATIMSAALLFSVVGSAGQQFALLRFIPPLLDRKTTGDLGEKYEIDDLLGRSFRLVLSGNLVVFFLLCVLAHFAPAKFAFEQPWLICLGFLIIPLVAVIDFQSYLARAYRSIIIALLPKDILWRFVTLLILGLIYLASGQSLPLHQPLIVLVAVLVLLIVGQNMLMQHRYQTPGLFGYQLRRTEINSHEDWEKSRFPFWVTSIASIAFTNVDVVAVGALIGPEAAALYFAANRISMVPQLFGNSFNIVLGPLFSAHFAANRRDALKATAQSATLQVTVLTLLLVVALWVGSPQILNLFGPEFVGASQPLQILLIAAVANSFFGSNELLLSMCGKERSAMRNGAISTGVGVILIVAGAVSGSITNLAICVAVAIVFARLLSWNSVVRELGFSADFGTAALAKIRMAGRSNGRTN